MNKLTLTTLAVVVALPTSVYANPASRAEIRTDELVFEDPIHYHNMTLVPVLTLKHGPFTRFTLLEEGFEDKSLKVREKDGNSGQAQVNTVQIKNTGGYKAFILGGEMILGGKQDRIISADTIIPNDGKWHDVPVFCVEQGRWRGRNMNFSSGKALAHNALRQAAMSDEQGKVWAEVTRKNVAHKTDNPTQTYRRTVQNAELRKRIGKFRRDIEKKLPKGQLAGFVFAVNGQVRIADMFGNPRLLGDLKDKLLSAYILEALEKDVDKKAEKVSKGSAKSFYKKAKQRVRSLKTKVSGKAKNVRKRGKGVMGTVTADEEGTVLRESYLAE